MTRLSLVPPVFLSLILQLSSSPPIRLGLTGNRLTADDLAQIGRLDVGGRAVWVVVGHPHGLILSNSWYVDVVRLMAWVAD